MNHFKSHKTLTSIWFCGFFILYLYSALAHAQTFVSLKPNITQTLIELAANDKILGITKFCPKPNSFAKVIADYQNIDVESLVRLNPDYVLISKENTQKKQFEQLEMALKGSKTKILILSFDTIDEFYESFLKLSDILNKSDAAAKLVQYWQKRLENIKTLRKDLSQKTFAIIVQREPLIVASGHTYLSTLLSATGLVNIFEKNQIAYPTLNPETLLQSHPDFVFDMSHLASDDPQFWGQPVTPIKIEDFLAHPQSIENTLKLIESLAKS